MSELARPVANARRAPPAQDRLFAAPWSALDDDALLAHYRGPRGVRFTPVIDPQEIRAERIAGILHGCFEFNGETHPLPEPLDWLRNPSADVEWHILLHKFYYAVGLAQAWQRSGDARYAQRWSELVDGWMRAVPPGFIAADVTGRRVQNWIYSLHGLLMPGRPGEAVPIAAPLLRRVLHSLHGQVEYLCAHLTPKRNHRTLELLAIFLAGVVFPEFARAGAWREFALAETLCNLGADLLADGVHCELSTDYHHLALRNWLQVRTLAADNGIAVPAAMDAALQRALDFALHVHQPSGRVPSLSDGDARGYRPLLALGARLYGRDDLRWAASAGAQGRAPARRIAHFATSGYHVVRSDWSAERFADAQHLVFDCGPLGEGNHGHFDALSFELAAFGRPLVVDPGRYTYSEAGSTNWRVHFRSTAAHNTVCVDDRPQTRYLPKPVKPPSRHAPGEQRHRIAGPAPDTTLIDSVDGDAITLLHGRCASHEYDAVHERCVVFVDRRYWIVADWLRAASEHDYRLQFQLGAPAQGRTRLDDTHGVSLTSPGLSLVQPARSGQRARLVDGWVSTLYGQKERAPVLHTEVRAANADFDSVLWPWSGRALGLRVHDLPAHGDRGAMSQALSIEYELDGIAVRDGWFHARGAAPQRWSFAGIRFFGRWLHWRSAADGRTLRAVSHAGAELHAGPGTTEPIVERAP